MHTKDGPSLCLGCELCWGKELQVFSPLLGMSNNISANEFIVCGGPYSNSNLNNVDMMSKCSFTHFLRQRWLQYHCFQLSSYSLPMEMMRLPYH